MNVAAIQTHNSLGIVNRSIKQLMSGLNLFDKLLSVKNFVYNVFNTHIRFLQFLIVIEVTNAYNNKLSQEFQEAGYIVAMIAYMVFDDATKNIVLKVGDDGYPEVKVKVSDGVSSKELINKLEKISEIVWNLSDEKNKLLWVSVTVSR
ncbi:hypothetical protein ACO3VM_02045 [Methanocaldococcus sp. 10A]